MHTHSDTTRRHGRGAAVPESPPISFTPSVRTLAVALAAAVLAFLLVAGLAQASPTTGSISVKKGGFRDTASNGSSGYAKPLAGAVFEYSSSSSFPPTPTVFPPTDATGYAKADGVPGDSSGPGIRYYVREKTSPAGWGILPMLTWDGLDRPLVGTANVTSGTATTRVDGSLERFVDRADNPELDVACEQGIKVLLLLDRSGSTSGFNDAYNAAAQTFVDTLAGTKTELKISSFATDSTPGTSFFDLMDPMGVDAANAKIDAIYPNNTSGRGSTNWDLALQDAAKAGVDVIVFVTDGNPTVNQGDLSSGGNTSIEDISFGIASANLAKYPAMDFKGATQRLLGVGVGADLAEPNLQAVSGPTAGDDYVIAKDPTELAEVLKGIASTLCTGTLTVEKSLLPAGDPGLFDLWIDGEPVVKGVGDGGTTGPQTVSDGEHVIDEAGSDGTDLADYDTTVACVDDDTGEPVPVEGGPTAASTKPTGTKRSVTVKAEQRVTCTYENTYRTPSLTLVKEVVNDSGGTATVADFTLTATGTDGNDVSGTSPAASGPGLRADTWTLSESGPAGYKASEWACDGGSLEGDQITLAAGESAVCTVVNDDVPATLIVVKDVVNGQGGTATAADFTLTSGGANAVPASFPGAGGSGTEVTLDAGPYEVAETAGPAGYRAAFSEDCAGTIALGETRTCTVTNTRLGTITVAKSLSPTTNTGLFDLQIDGTTLAAGVGNGGTTGPQSLEPGAHTVAELAAAGTSLAAYTSAVTCSDATGVLLTASPATTAGVTLADGQDVVCTFTNTAIPPATPPTTVVAPPAVVLPPVTIRGRAILRAPTGCVDTGSVATRVTVRNAKTVLFYRDGRLAKRITTGTQAQRTYTLDTAIRPGDYTLHRVEVRVRYVTGAKPAIKVMSHRFGQCRASSVTG